MHIDISYEDQKNLIFRIFFLIAFHINFFFLMITKMVSLKRDFNFEFISLIETFKTFDYFWSTIQVPSETDFGLFIT